jgi:hypothetical protein
MRWCGSLLRKERFLIDDLPIVNQDVVILEVGQLKNYREEIFFCKLQSSIRSRKSSSNL